MTHLKAARISPDSRPIAYGAAGLAAAIYLGAFATSFFGQASLAQFMLIPGPLQFVAPAVVDLALILFTVATLVRRSRSESTLVTNLATGFWTAVSIAANIAHVLIPAGPLPQWSPGTYAGATLSALMPLAALGASLVVENVLIARPGGAKVAPAAAKLAAPEASKPAIPMPSVADSMEPKLTATIVSDTKTEKASRIGSKRLQEPPLPEPSSPEATHSVASARAIVGKPELRCTDWESLTKAERASRIQELKDEGLSLPKISGRLGVSLSTVKRCKSEQEERQLQDA